MQFKVVPFTATITKEDSSVTIAAQMQRIIDSTGSQGWEYMRMDSVQTSESATQGCFGLGSQPGFTTNFIVLVFKREV